MWTLRCRGLPDEKYDDLVSHQADALAGLFWTRLGEFLQRTSGEHDLTPIEKQCWIQSGLALSRLMATCTQYFLIGEWASCILLPVPRGPWPRHGHTDALLPEYRARSPRFVDWASCFCPLYSSCKGWCLSSHCLGIRCFSRLALVKEGSGLQSCMHMEVPRQEWQKRYDLLQVRGGCHLLLPWWAHRASYRCGLTRGFGLSLAPRLTSRLRLLSQFLAVPLTLGSLRYAANMGLNVKILPTSAGETLTYWKRLDCFMTVVFNSCQRWICRVNR